MVKRFFNNALFLYVSPLIRVGRTRPLTELDVVDVPPDMEPRNASDKFANVPTDTFFRFIWEAFLAVGTPARMVLVITCVRLCIAMGTPILLHSVLTQLPTATFIDFPWVLLLTSVSLGLVGMTGAVVQQHFYFNALKTFGIIVNGLNRRVVKQALTLRHSSRATMNTGDMVNHLSSDTDAIAESGFFIPEFLNTVLETILILIVLTWFLGWAAIAAYGALLLLSPLTILVSKRYRKLDHQIMELRDERVTLMSQILQGIRVIKFQAWEHSVRAEVESVRSKEIATKVRIVKTDAVSTMLFVSTTTVVAFVGFSTFVILGGALSAPLIFACIALFAMLEEPFGLISHLLANLQHARVATTRLHKYFQAKVRSQDMRPISSPNKAIGIEVTGLRLRYPDATSDAVQVDSLNITAGMSVAVIGQVGSGKSTLLRCLASMHELTSGLIEYTDVRSDCRIRSAYVPQEAFIMNASLLDNIRFGADDYQANSISEIVEACALEADLALMPAGLATEIGERGVNLSGGQKQRVSLARAVFHKPGIVFLDDPLSAVDVETESALVDRLLFGAWNTITRIVVTHRLTHLNRFDKVIVVHEGKILGAGTFQEIEHLVPRSVFQHEAEAAPIPEMESFTHLDATPHTVPQEVSHTSTRITDDEDREVGAVEFKVYVDYIRAMVGKHKIFAPLNLFLLLASATAITVLPMVQTVWMGYWTEHNDVATPLIAVFVYGILGTLVLTGWLGERLLWLYRSARAGQTIHDLALSGVLNSTIRFFDSTPMGRVLNRFSRDMEGVDDHLSWNFEQSFKSLAQTIGSLILIVSILPIILLVLVPVLFIYYRLQRDYRASAREAKRLESVARSPRYAHFKELVSGLDVIHGFGKEPFFLDSFYSILSNHQHAFWRSILLNRWFSVRVPIVGGLIALATSVGVVLLARDGALSAGIAGVVLTYALSFWMNLNWTVRAFSEVESRMTSVERLKRYADLQPENSTLGPALVADATQWPTRGRIEVKGLCVRYAHNLPRVLHNVSFNVEPGWKVGITGRTGSGKSTLFQSMFRFVEAEAGEILVDGMNIAQVPLGVLRRGIAIIPQDPTLFIGTIRSNIDRFDECSDEQVWSALRRVQLAGLILGLPSQLQSSVSENGSNFSQGQRQLLCMARAILTRAKIIVMDEATASVDHDTDVLIQQTIREEFADVTVLVIAHRLETVADANLLVELAGGRVQKITKR